MNHRIVNVVVIGIVALFAAAALLFAWAAAARVPETARVTTTSVDTPHPPEQRTRDCKRCHKVENGNLPLTHRAFPVDGCGSCHEVARVVRVPHSVSMGEDGCPLCHGDPSRELGIPDSHLRYEERQCLLCHQVLAEEAATEPEPAGPSLSPAPVVPHQLGGFFSDCGYCHQLRGDHPLPISHEQFTQVTCLECHKPAASAVAPGVPTTGSVEATAGR